MLKVFDDNSVYVGKIDAGQRSGKGIIYMLDDFFAGCKVSGNWQNDKLHGWGTVSMQTYTEKGNFNNGIKTGTFLRYYNDGRCSAIMYEDGTNISEEVYSKGNNEESKDFACIKLSNNKYYMGDIWNNLPFGYGVIYSVDDKKEIVGKTFVKIYGEKFTPLVELDKKIQENEGISCR